MAYAILGVNPTVQQVRDAHVEMPYVANLNEIGQDCAQVIAKLFDDLKLSMLKTRDPDEVMKTREVELLIAHSIQPLVDTFAHAEDSQYCVQSLELLDRFIKECADRLLPKVFIGRSGLDIAIIGFSNGALARLANNHREPFEKAADKGLNALGRYMGTFSKI